MPNHANRAVVDETSAEKPDSNTSHYPNCLFLGGRGQLGKSFAARWFLERAREVGRAVRVADADHTNQTLRGFVSDAVSPPSADPVSVQGWLEDELASAAATNTSIIVDFGAGDQVIANLAREVTLVEAIKEIGLQPTAVYFIGADPDDVATVEMLLHSFAPTATIIAYARHVVARHVDPSVALRSLIERSNMLSALLDGDARLVPVPVLSCAHKLSERRVGFLDAMSGHGPEPLGPFDRQRVTTWWRAMETAFTPVLHWLP